MNNKISFKGLLQEFLFYRHLRPETVKCYKKAIKQLTDYAPDLYPDDVSSTILINWRNNILRRVKPTSWNTYVRHLRAVFSFGIEQGLISLKKNPFQRTFIREEKYRKKVYSEEQLIQLENFFKQKIVVPDYLKPIWFIEALVMTFRYTGIRCSQLLQLQIKDINLSKRVINISPEINKNHDYHVLPISDKLFPYIVKLLKELKSKSQSLDDQLFNINLFSHVVKRQGLPMSINQINHIFRTISEQVGFKVSSHRFRHTIATQIMKDPKNLYIAQKLLGHKDLKVTLSYIEHDVDAIRDYVNLL
ncbi:Site-specific recombinase XerD [Pasteurella testudinis DSM 23072]|uniref:Site-specific recombinase XerD n=1 Tax=Pasteurella testudinis DSM 23072 TaxID=1122938 RepID=A0A1W1UNA3_9PAST|nr:site-specific integrase [Pasteurella testudinis]SMB82469.1 Site-specific recombinase XerD [Pasteurella testudinis DSM 23072]SUB52197.1 tyrosine recombinase-2 family protein [Pasteurella testudinis]